MAETRPLPLAWTLRGGSIASSPSSFSSTSTWYFRPPTGSTSDAVEVFFWINQDGSAGEMRVVRSSGSYRFQLAALEAVEQAGNNKAFGPLPGSFRLDRLPVSFYFRPAR